MKNIIAITMSDKPTFEVKQLVELAKKMYEDVLLIDARNVYYKFIRGDEVPDIIFNDKNINKLPIIIIRMTRGREASTAILANALLLCGCNIVDPIERFQTISTSKLLTTLQRFKNKSGSSTFIAFTKDNALKMINDLSFPLMGKPVDGKRSKDLVVINNLDEAKSYVNNFFKKRNDVETPIFLQEYVDFFSELRVFVVNGNHITWMKKQKFRKKKIGMKRIRKIIAFVEEKCSDKGILGVDVGIDKQENIHIIEANRAPQWKFISSRTKTNIAEEILKSIKEG